MISEPEPGPGPARNAGVRSASGEILAFIDADCRAHPEWLRVAACGIESSDGRTLLGGDVQIWDDGASNCTAIEAYERVFAYRFKMYIERQGFSGTGNLITPRDAFDKIGPFAGIRVAEDMEWGARALSSGFRFQHVPEMIVFHPARRTLDELYQKWDRQTQHYLNMNAAKGGRLWKARWVLRALAILASPALDIGSVLRSKKVAGWSARSKAIMVLCQVRTHRALKMLTLMFGRRQVRWNENSLEA
jgi:glycosyltransferase involved in cell wall biosynthesis